MSDVAAAVRAAAAARTPLPYPAVRLVDGAGDHLPRLVVERFGDAFWVRGAPDRAADLPAVLAGLDDPAQVFWRFGHAERGGPAGDDGARVVAEGPLQFHVHLGENRNPGLFLDGREARAWVRAHSADRAVLNLFAYT
ncbi:MAG: class I SAM-dependent methyltransferase, partial [Myxococcales bacterium]|nr:class I SAM-dependent methyltransferase [Myxococcales bacterium]